VQLNLFGDTGSGANSGIRSEPKTQVERLQFHESTYRLGFEADLPFDRKDQRNDYVSKLIDLQQQQRSYDEDIENVKLDVRQAYRDLEEKAESYRIQKISLDLARRRVEEQKLKLEYGRVTIRDLVITEDALVSAQNKVTVALVEHTVVKLNFFRDIGVLQVKPDGMWEQRIQ